ncbi:hypothetical protein AWY96_00795 [Serratia plymuthica]|uniref:hypothetical protein n=1 Tax=Serratia plymuthica TaxID=82996 RepID=UPI0007A004D1|nr:hypothetical protein [Serratia plymuthica]KYQ97110.1 hypothetical protein AWY96_00795 [Serratia plymuthica]
MSFQQVLNVVTNISTADIQSESAQRAIAEKVKADAEQAKAEAEAEAEAKKNKAEAEKNKEAANKTVNQLQLQQFNIKHNIPQNLNTE